MYPKFIAPFCMLLLISGASAISVGTAPGLYDLGELKPGRDYAFSFYLTTNSKSDLLVSLGYIRVHSDIYNRNHTGRYTFLPAEASQEEISSWVEIPKNTLLLSPSNVKIVNLETGGVVKAYGEANIILHVPEDAEPGFHAGAINLGPQIPSKAVRGTGVATFGITRFIFVFRVVGNAIRKGEIMTLVGSRVGGKKAKIDVLFRNSGTCTMEAWVDYLRLYDKFGNLTATLTSGRQKVKPGKVVALQAYWSGNDVKPGDYRAEARVNYLTGHATFEEKVSIPTSITIEREPGVVTNVGEFPWLNIILIIMIILLVLYWRFI